MSSTKLGGKGAVLILLAVCAMTFLHDARFAGDARTVHGVVAHARVPVLTVRGGARN